MKHTSLCLPWQSRSRGAECRHGNVFMDEHTTRESSSGYPPTPPPLPSPVLRDALVFPLLLGAWTLLVMPVTGHRQSCSGDPGGVIMPGLWWRSKSLPTSTWHRIAWPPSYQCTESSIVHFVAVSICTLLCLCQVASPIITLPWQVGERPEVVFLTSIVFFASIVNAQASAASSQKCRNLVLINKQNRLS